MIKKIVALVVLVIALCACEQKPEDNYIPVTDVSLNQADAEMFLGETLQLQVKLAPSNATEQDVMWGTNKRAVATVSETGLVTAVGEGTATITVTAAGSKRATCLVTVTVNPVQQYAGEENGHYFVDLGLPSGVLWATCNIGAENPEEYGDFFAWGETEPYYDSQVPLTWKSGKSAGYDLSSYRWYNVDNDYMTKYNTDCFYGPVKIALDMEDDAARVKWGGKWRLPTWSDFEELISSCTTEWVAQNGVVGRLFTGSNGNSIFLPAAGNWFYSSHINSGRYGYYWSSSLDSDAYSSWRLVFGQDFVKESNERRYEGYPVRPVTSNSFSVRNYKGINIKLLSGETLDLGAQMFSDNAIGQTIIWESSNRDVAIVDNNGLVTATGIGEAEITALCGYSTTCLVTVKPMNKPIFAQYKSINLRLGQNLTGGFRVWAYYGSEDDYRSREDIINPIWTSQDQSVVTVDNDGNVMTVGVGSTIITISDDKGDSLDIPVTVTPLANVADDWLPGIRLIEPTRLYDGNTGWFAEGCCFIGEGFAPGSRCFHVKDYSGDCPISCIAQAKFPRVDVSSVKNPALYLRVYVNNVHLLMLDGDNSQMELVSEGESHGKLIWSAGRVFSNDYWPGHCPDPAPKYELKEGWNTIVLPFDYAEQIGDAFDLARVCLFRWNQNPDPIYDLAGKGLEVAVDDLRVVDWTEYAAVDLKNKELWMESGTAKNWATYDWQDSLDGHDYVFGAKDDYMNYSHSVFFLRARRDEWKSREYSIPANMNADEMKLVWQLWIDEPSYYNSWEICAEIATGAGTYDQFGYQWLHEPGSLGLKAGWNIIEEPFINARYSGQDPPDPRSLYTFRLVFFDFSEYNGVRRHSYYIDDIRILKR